MARLALEEDEAGALAGEPRRDREADHPGADDDDFRVGHASEFIHAALTPRPHGYTLAVPEPVA